MPPTQTPRPRVNIHIRVNIGALLNRGRGGLRRSFVRRIDHGVEHRVTGSGVLECDDLFSRQSIAHGGVLDLVHDDRFTDVGLNHGLNLGNREPGTRRRRGDRIRPCDAARQQEARQREEIFYFHSYQG